MHAEPITFGLKLANWYSEVVRDLERFERAAEDMRVGKLSGAVGTFAHLDPEMGSEQAHDISERVEEKLTLAFGQTSSTVHVETSRHCGF
jgi:adenylosuccinate lyase